MINEWVKLVRRKRLWVCTLLGLALVGLFTYGGYRNQQNQLKYVSPAAVERQIADTKQQLAKAKANPSAPQAEQNISQLQSQLQGLQQQYAQESAQTSSHWRASVQQQLNQLKAQQAIARTQGDANMLGQLQGQILPLQYELNNNVKPVPGWQTTAYQVLSQFLSEVTQIFMPLITVILVADMVAGETTSGTIKLLLIRPASRAKVLLGKWLVSLLGTVLLTVVMPFAFLGTSSLVLGGGGALQPVVVGTTYTFLTQPGSAGVIPVAHYAHAHVISQATYDFVSIALMLAAMLVVATIAFLCSVLFQSAMAATAVSLGVVIVGTIAVQLLHGHWIVALFPVHLDLAREWTGNIAQQMHQYFHLRTGLVVLAVWTVVALALSLYRFTKRDVMNA